MDKSKINMLLRGITTYDIGPLDDDMNTMFTLNDGTIINLHAGTTSLMLFTMVETLGDSGKESPVVYERLLHANILGGRFGNIRIVYDMESTVVWLNYDLPFETLDAVSLMSSLESFVKNSQTFKLVLKDEIIEAVEHRDNDQSSNPTRGIAKTSTFFFPDV